MTARVTLRPQSAVDAAQLADGKRALVQDAAWASVTGALSGGVVLVAFALSLGAGPLTIGLLAAIPFLAQAAQLPAILLTERLRERKRIGVPLLMVARSLIMLLALLPFLPVQWPRLAVLVAFQLGISLLGSMAACAINSWFHQLLPAEGLGAFFAKRLIVASVLACAGTLGVGLLVDHPPLGDARVAYALAFVGAALAGYASCYFLARTPEPRMPDHGTPGSLIAMLRRPFHDPNFRRLLTVLGAWNLATNLAAPFLTVYLIQQLGYGLTTVTALWVASQLANALTLYIWGRLSDRLSNKAILAVALPTYFLCTLGLVFSDMSARYDVQLTLICLLHVVMGAASGGIGLATGNLGLKLAPRDQGTAYLAAIGLVSAAAGGVAPIAGGALAQAFSANELSVIVRWVSLAGTSDVSVVRFAHWEFLFALSAMLGIYVMHALSRIQEGDEYSERRVIQELGLEALRTVNHLSSIGGVLGGVFPFERISQGLAKLPRRRRVMVHRPVQQLARRLFFRRRTGTRGGSRGRP
ncbi:hypothetical protein GCM10007242_06330 [Pigmentiphaga litoralis]|uniref:MFS transporter n=1 Tax=Pigmentiphaga litoralis TaxID=516702 RepID=UPI0016742147|nr:MFS transporter [Pigmentiphaga litoralis]GGX03946.1 hypothetical protein GCM10007242_06330 [Pigmentiphaga litoralis]